MQTIIEQNMLSFFGVRFLRSEYTTTNGGRMDSLGIDENNCPVIFEYKRSQNENVINQGLYYLNWLLDHKDSFKVLVIETLGLETAKQIDWSMPRVVCVAGDFTKFDQAAIMEMTHNISLVRYRKFGDALLMFEQLNENIVQPSTYINDNPSQSTQHGSDKTFIEQLANANQSIRDLYEDLRNYIVSLGDDVSENQLKLYVAFKKVRNIICVVASRDKLILHLQLDPAAIAFEDGFSRDVTKIGHWATGSVQLFLSHKADLEKAKPLLYRAYNEN